MRRRPALRLRRERGYEFSSCNRDSHWTPLRQVSTLGSGTIPCFGGCMNPLSEPNEPETCGNEPETSAATTKVKEGTVWQRMSVPI